MSQNTGYFTDKELVELGFHQVGTNVQISRLASIVGHEFISMGDNIRVDDFVSIICSGAGFMKVGSYVHIAANCYLNCSGGVTMESFSGLSQGVRVYSASDDYSGEFLTNPTTPTHLRNVSVAAVRLGRHSIVGSGSTIMPGTILEEGVAVGAMSLAKGTLPAWGIYFGIPARRIRERSRNILDIEDKNFPKGG